MFTYRLTEHFRLNQVLTFQFAGTWHEISAYPKASQSGQCISQQFTVTNANTMKLESFSVLDQFQTTTEGVATIDSTDGSGRLNINIQSNGQSKSYFRNTNYS